ncbi:Transcriptional regulator, TetR family [Alloactinosynnema sp. L-07]|uniref:TetR/AcrR family transcriptional regulator n=1 Tax=Alloactinosynnema sp. L-07 TaxID=1653480 RepID=UPI00065EFD5B|nr:TetR/AcrR family transcriptional regulator [Alloactinosynnema sp. L-07]CRK58843.1 Transcriptional regulator, TetR family [Alloactinosynnema sp. L-07]
MGHREQLLAAARKLLEDKGYAHITARDLVAESATNLASIGYHFGSKAGLLNEALGVVFEEWTDQLAKVALAEPDATPIARAHLTWAAVLRNLADNRMLVLSFAEALAQAERDPALRAQLADLQDHTRTRVAAIVATSFGPEVTADDPRCRAVASFVLAVCDGFALQWMLDPVRTPQADDLLQGLAELLARSAPF